MPLFDYTALNEQGIRVDGQVDADSADDARQIVAGRGLQAPEVSPRASKPSTVPRLSAADSVEIVEKVAGLAGSNLPIAAGLRAAADESNRRSVRNSLRRIAADVELGVPLSSALSARAAGFPRFLQGLVAAATRTGHLPHALDECLSLQREMQSVRRTLIVSLIYPLILLSMLTGLAILLFAVIVPEFKLLFEDFGLQLPAMTTALIRASDAWLLLVAGGGRFMSIGLAAGIAMLLIIVRCVIGKPNWSWLLGTIPLIGPSRSWSAAAAFARMLGILVDQQVPLPEALVLTGEGVHDANVREACRRFAGGVAAGSRLSELIAVGHRLPKSIVPFVEAGEANDELPGALRAASDMLLERVRLRMLLIRSVVPPIIFVFVTLCVLLALVGLTTPMFTLINGMI